VQPLEILNVGVSHLVEMENNQDYITQRTGGKDCQIIK
jgi:hypothetical protein